MTRQSMPATDPEDKRQAARELRKVEIARYHAHLRALKHPAEAENFYERFQYMRSYFDVFTQASRIGPKEVIAFVKWERDVLRRVLLHQEPIIEAEVSSHTLEDQVRQLKKELDELRSKHEPFEFFKSKVDTFDWFFDHSDDDSVYEYWKSKEQELKQMMQGKPEYVRYWNEAYQSNRVHRIQDML